MRIATLMIDGFGGGKLPKFLDWLKQPKSPDIVALQKIGSRAGFRACEFHQVGYGCSVRHKESYKDGVALLTRAALGEPTERCGVLPGAEGDGARLLTVEIAGLLVSSLYAPYGNPDKWKKVLGNRRLAHERAIEVRVTWLRRLREHVQTAGYAHRDSLLCGDFNVKTKSDGPPNGGDYSEREHDELEKLLKLGFCDVYRRRHPDPRTMPGFTLDHKRFRKTEPKSGSRLHLVIASEGLAERLISASVDMDANIRAQTRPLVVEFSNPDR